MVSAEHRLVLGFLADGGSMLFGTGTPDELLCHGKSAALAQTELIAAARSAQGADGGPVIVTPWARTTVEAILDDPAIEQARLLLLDCGDVGVRAELEAMPWGQWPRLDHVDLEYLPPRVIEDVPGSQRLHGGVGLVVIGPRRSGPRPNFVPMARLLPGLRSAAMPPRIAALELESAQARLERAERVIGSLTSSASWRVTAPLRAAKSAARGRAGR
jgi:hypothetical protein